MGRLFIVILAGANIGMAVVDFQHGNTAFALFELTAGVVFWLLRKQVSA